MFGSSNRTIIQTQTSKTTQKWVTEHKSKLLLWPFLTSDLNPVEDEWGELKRRNTVIELWIWSIWRDSGWRNDLWSLVRCSRTSSFIIGEHLELLNWRIWRDSGWRNGLWSLVRCSRTSSGIIEEHLELLNWRIWRDSGWRNGLWSLVRCSRTSSGIIEEHLELLNWRMEVSKSIKEWINE